MLTTIIETLGADGGRGCNETPQPEPLFAVVMKDVEIRVFDFQLKLRGIGNMCDDVASKL